MEKSAYSATADILPDAKGGKVLRMIAWKPEDSTSRSLRDDLTPLLVTSPAIDVSLGDVMVVTGRIRKGRSTSAESKKPLIIFDSELGPVSGLRIPLYSDWESFEMIRPIGNNSSFTVSFAMAGQGAVEEVHIDDLTIRRLPAMPEANPLRLTGDVKYSTEETPATPRKP
jgi:hypothetical protein